MGVSGLMSYIIEHKDRTTKKVDLAKEEKVVLICDLPNVVGNLEQNILRSRVHSLPDFCGFYGGDLKLLAQQFNNFITALRHLRIKVIYVCDAPFGADEDDFHQKLEEKLERQRKKHQKVEDWSEWCGADPMDSINTPPNKEAYLRCSLAVRVCSKVLLDRGEELVMSHTEADHWIISHFKERRAFGVLSNDSDFGVSYTCRFIPLDPKLFEMEGFRDGSVNPEPRSLICRYTDSRYLSQSLKISGHQLIHLAIICGNDFTKNFNVYEDIGICAEGKKRMQVVEEVSQWLQQNNFRINAISLKKRNDQRFKHACEYSEAFYRGRITEPNCNSRFLDRVQKHQLSPSFLSIENGQCWMEFLPEPLELCGKAHELTKKLRKVLYSLCGCTCVVESGKIQNKVMCEEVVKVESTPSPINCRGHFPTKVARLCQIIAGTKYEWFELSTHESYLSDRSLVRVAVIASTLNYVLRNYTPMAELDYKFIMSFLFAVATCSLDLSTDRKILEMQRSAPKIESWIQNRRYVNSSVASLSAIFMATLPYVYNIAGFLGLTDYLPNMADIFSPAIFVPTMVQCLKTKYKDVPKLSPLQLLDFNTLVADCSSTVTIRNLCLFASQFENAVNFVRTELRPH